MRILIAANAVRMGGALEHLSGLLPAFVQAAPQHEWLVITNAQTAKALPALPERVLVETCGTERLDPLRRLLTEQRLLATRGAAFGADVALSFNSFALLGAPWPQVLIAANALYVCPEYWRRLSSLSLSRRVAERLRCALLGRSLRLAAYVVTPSQWMAGALRHRFGLPPERVRVAHHGVNPLFVQAGTEGQRAAGAGTPVVLAVSKHGINKDFGTLVRATRLLVDAGWRQAWVQLSGMSSESPYAHATAELIARLGLEQQVTFLGDLSPAELARNYLQAGVFVFPSWCEAFGLPQVEAAASGLAVIAPDLAVSRELLGDAARYYRPFQPRHLAGHLAALLANPDQARELGVRAAERARAYTWPRAALETLAALEAAASRPEAIEG